MITLAVECHRQYGAKKSLLWYCSECTCPSWR